MLSVSSGPLVFYPAYCWPASATYNTWVKLTIADVYGLKEHVQYQGQQLCFHQNHPIRYLRVVGLVVSFDSSRPNLFIFHIEDGSSAVLEVTLRKDTSPPVLAQAGEMIQMRAADKPRVGRSGKGYEVDLSGVEIGKVVKVKGCIGSFRGVRQVLLERVWVVGDTAEEVGCWEETVRFKEEILDEPWKLGLEDVARLKREEERATGKRMRKEAKRWEKRKRKKEEAKADDKPRVNVITHVRKRGDLK